MHKDISLLSGPSIPLFGITAEIAHLSNKQFTSLETPFKEQEGITATSFLAAYELISEDLFGKPYI